jgi:hypothetical protein
MKDLIQPSHGNGSKGSHRETKPTAFKVPGASKPSKTESTPHTKQPSVHFDIDDYEGKGGGRGSGISLVRLSLRDLWVSICQLIARRLGVQDQQQIPIAPELAVECMTQFEVKQKAERSQLIRKKTQKKVRSKKSSQGSAKGRVLADKVAAPRKPPTRPGDGSKSKGRQPAPRTRVDRRDPKTRTSRISHS